MTKEEIREAMHDSRYPMTNKYDPDWIIGNQMGSHCLWLLESLTREMSIKSGMRVLDMGCGMALGSIFLAREFGVEVWATDLWISASDNWQRIREAGVENLVRPIHAEAHDLPYADGFFDAAVSINALQFFATGEYYLNNHFTRLVKPGGQIGIVVPGVYAELDEAPEYLKEHWLPEFHSWHSPAWWKRHWERTGLVGVKLADTFPDREGNRIFELWGRIVSGEGDPLLIADRGRNITFVRVVADRNAAS